MSDSPAHEEFYLSQPKRRRRMGCLGRLSIAGVILLLVLVVLYGTWTWRTHRLLDARVAELRAAGEPMSIDALAPSQPVPDDQNAAILYKRAMDALDPAFVGWIRNIQPSLALPLRDSEIEPLREGIQAAAPALALASQAASMPLVDWQMQWTTPIAVATIPYLNEARSLANVLHAAALLAHHEGDDAAALRHIGQMESLADALEQQTTLIQHLVASGIRALAADAVEQVMPDLAAADNAAAETRTLIARLLEEGQVVRGLQDAWRFERLAQYDTVMGLTGTPLAPATQPTAEPFFSEANGVMKHLLKPVFFTDGSIMLNHMTGLVAATAEPTLWRFQQAIPAMPDDWEDRPRYPLSNVLLPSLDRAGMVHYRILTDRRLAAASLAVRLYALDHDGQLPPTMDTLVPDYLPAVPADPFSKEDAPLRYDPARAILYSVGEDGSDDGGSRTPRRPSRRYEDEPPTRWETLDAIFPLTRQPRPPAPPTEEELWEDRVEQP